MKDLEISYSPWKSWPTIQIHQLCKNCLLARANFETKGEHWNAASMPSRRF